MRSSVVVAGLLASPSLAAADDPPPVQTSPFVTMFHEDAATKVDIDAAYMFVNNVDLTYVVGAISARYDLGKVKPYVAVSIPIDDGARQVMKAGVTIGLTATP